MKTIFTFLFALLSFQSTHSQWQMINSPLATPDIRKVAHHPDGYIIAITNENEVFRSDNNGENWERISIISGYPVTDLSISPQGFIYAGTSRGYSVSTDNGIDWIPRNMFSNISHVSDMEFLSNGYTILLEYDSEYAEYSRVWISTNNGNTWTSTANGLNGEALVSITKDTFENLFMLTIGGALFKSSDNGYSWQLISDISNSSFDLEIDSNNNLFVAASNNIYKSTNFGNTWYLISNGWTYNIFIDDNNFIYANNFDDLIFSSDGGNSWLNLGLTGTAIYDIKVIINTIYVCTGTSSSINYLLAKGLQKTSDFGVTWITSFRYTDRFVVVNDILAFENKIIAAGREGLYITHDTGNDWDTVIVSNMNLIKKDNAGNLYAAANSTHTSEGELYRSTDEGITWNQSGNINYVRNFNINDSDFIYIVTYNVVIQSPDQGVSWDTIGNFVGNPHYDLYGISKNLFGSIFITSFANIGPPAWTEFKKLIKTDNNGTSWILIRDDLFIKNVYFSNDTMYLAASNGIYKSYNNGISIIPLNNGLNNFDIKQLILQPEVFLALAGDGIYRSLDNGEYWVRLDHSGLPSTAINRIYYSEEGVLYACTGNGIYVFTGELPVELLSFTATTETGRVTLNWTTASELNNQGFEIQRKSKSTEWLTIGFKEGKGTSTEKNDYTFVDDVTNINSNEVYYRLKQIDFDGSYTYSEEVKIGLIPFKYELYQNYPNPFNPKTTISWQSPVGSHQTLKVYDILGNEVATLVNEYKEAGNYEVEFNASSLASGMYIYKLSAGSFTSSKKMLILK